MLDTEKQYYRNYITDKSDFEMIDECIIVSSQARLINFEPINPHGIILLELFRQSMNYRGMNEIFIIIDKSIREGNENPKDLQKRIKEMF